MVSALGWTWFEAGEQLDLPTLIALNKHWAHSPPVHMSVARYLGYKAAAETPKVLPVKAEAGPILDMLLETPLELPASAPAVVAGNSLLDLLIEGPDVPP